MRLGGNSARFVSRNIALTEFTRSIFESIRVPSRSNTKARTAPILPFDIEQHSNMRAVDSVANEIPDFSQFRSSRKLEGWPPHKISTGDPMAQVQPFRAYRYNPDVVAYDRVKS